MGDPNDLPVWMRDIVNAAYDKEMAELKAIFAADEQPTEVANLIQQGIERFAEEHGDDVQAFVDRLMSSSAKPSEGGVRGVKDQ